MKNTTERGATWECFGTSFVFDLHDRARMDFKTTQCKVQNACR